MFNTDHPNSTNMPNGAKILDRIEMLDWAEVPNITNHLTVPSSIRVLRCLMEPNCPSPADQVVQDSISSATSIAA